MNELQKSKVSLNDENIPPEENTPELEGKKCSVQMIVGPKEAKKTKTQIDAYIKKMTHLHLENKGIEVV